MADTDNTLQNTQIGPGTGAPPTPPTPNTPDVGQIPFQDAGNPLIVTSRNYQTGLTKSSTNLDGTLRNINPNYPYPAPPPQPPQEPTDNPANYSDAFTKQLDAISNSSNDSTKSLIASIHAARANQQGALDQKYEMYTRGLQLLGVETGSAASTPELLAGHIQQAENDHQSKISDLVAKETKAVMDAQQARDDGNLKLMHEKMTYVSDIQKQKATALKDYYDTITSGGKAADSIAGSVYSKLQSLDPSQKEAYLQQVATQYKVPLDSLVSSVASYQQAQTKESLTEENLRSEIANRGGSGGTPLTPSVLTSLQKTNPLLDLPYGTTSAEAQLAVQNANKIDALTEKHFQDPANVRDGKFTYDYVKTVLGNLPDGISEVNYLKKLYGQGLLTPKLEKHAADYGISKSIAKQVVSP